MKSVKRTNRNKEDTMRRLFFAVVLAAAVVFTMVNAHAPPDTNPTPTVCDSSEGLLTMPIMGVGIFDANQSWVVAEPFMLVCMAFDVVPPPVTNASVADECALANSYHRSGAPIESTKLNLPMYSSGNQQSCFSVGRCPGIRSMVQIC